MRILAIPHRLESSLRNQSKACNAKACTRISDSLFKSQFVEMLGKGDYPEAPIEELCNLFCDGDWIESKDQDGEGNIRLVQTGNVGNGVYLDKEARSRFINEKTFSDLNCTEIFFGDVLVSRLPDPVGRSCMLPEGLGKAITAVDCSILRFKDEYIPSVFVAFTKTPMYQSQINRFVTGSTRKRISRKNLGQIKIPVPPIELQREFAAFVQQVDKSKAATSSQTQSASDNHLPNEWRRS